jgi:hypothetical protein
MRLNTLLLVALLAACSKEEAKQKYEATKSKAGELANAAGEKATVLAADAKDAAIAAKDKAGELASAAGEKAGELAADAKDAAIVAGEKAGELAGVAKDKISGLISGAASAADVVGSVKKEFDKVYQSATTYDLAISTEGVDDAAMKKLEAEVAGLPTIEVGGAKIAYQDSSATTINNVTYAKSFGAVWVVGGKKIGLTFYTQQNIDTVAFAETLQKLVPVVEKYVK